MGQASHNSSGYHAFFCVGRGKYKQKNIIINTPGQRAPQSFIEPALASCLAGGVDMKLIRIRLKECEIRSLKLGRSSLGK